MKLDFYSIANTRVEYYEGMVEADIEIDKNHTAYITCEEKVVDKVKAMFQSKELSDEDRLSFTKAYFNIHPEAHLSEEFKIKLYELNDFACAILKKARMK